MTQKMNFDADVAQLIQLVTHSIYSNTDVFLRELLSNANDALQKAKLMSLQDTSYLGDQSDLKISLEVDTDNKIISITDTGIGMTKEEVISNIGTIAKSGTKDFISKLKDAKEASESSQLIGQFGIGFYSAFMVAKKVELETKSNEGTAVHRSSEGDGSYEIQDSTKTERGTTIRIYLNDSDDNDAYADHYRLRGLIKKHSNYVPVPIYMYKLEDSKPTTEREQINAMQSIWTKQKSSVKKEEYEEFYKTMSYSQEGPFDTIHVHIEGAVNYKALLYIPLKPSPFDQFHPDKEYGPSLYVNNVLILEHSKEILPVRLRFVKGVVETPDLSLNVSREILQDNKVLQKIQQSLINEVIKSLVYLKKNDADNYSIFYENFGRFLKEGVHFDQENKEKIAGLLHYGSLLTETKTGFAEYASGLAKNESEDEDAIQPPIYYLIGSSIQELKQSPYLVQFKESNTEVLLLDDQMDEYVVAALREYEGFPLTSASSPDIHLGDDQQKETEKKEIEKLADQHSDFLGAVTTLIGENELEEVTFTHKIGDNPGVLITPEGGLSPQMEQMMKSMGQEIPVIKRKFHINDKHPLVKKAMIAQSKDPTSFSTIMKYVYDQALLLEGGQIEDIAGFVRRVNDMLSK